MNVELVPVPDTTAFWSVVIATLVFLVLLYLPVQDKDLGGIRKLFAFLTGVPRVRNRWSLGLIELRVRSRGIAYRHKSAKAPW